MKPESLDVPEPQTDEDQRLTITGLVSYRLQLVGNLMSRSAAMQYKRKFGVTLWEWRAIALIGARPGLSLNELIKVVDLDKGLASRVVTALTERRLVVRRIDEQDARAVQLTLSPEGQRVYGGLINAAAARNDAFLSVLDPEEWHALDTALIKLERLGRDYLQQEKKMSVAARKKAAGRQV